jgi:hypothetical protein
MTSIRAILLAALGCAIAAPARAQSPLPPDPVKAGALNIGPVALDPRLEVRNAGLDSNVFNESEAPREDFTATVRPSLDAGMRFGIARVVYRSWLDLVYFHRYKDERSVNRFGEIRSELRLSRFVPYVAASGLDTKERPNNEIDLRADRSIQTVSAGAALAVLPSTAIVASVERQTTRFDRGQRFRGVDLADALDHRRDNADVGFRFALTSLTTLSLTGGIEERRFPSSPDRDSESKRFGARFEFDPTALISGTASVGYRMFSPVSADIEPFEGVVAHVMARYVAGNRTLFGVQFTRDVEYSFEADQPYYVATGGSVTVTQRIKGPFDVQIVGARERLRYRRRLGLSGEASVDTTSTAAAGVGYRIGEHTRLGVSVEFTERAAERAGQSYDRRRILGSVTYGF